MATRLNPQQLEALETFESAYQTYMKAAETIREEVERQVLEHLARFRKEASIKANEALAVGVTIKALGDRNRNGMRTTHTATIHRLLDETRIRPVDATTTQTKGAHQ